MPAKIESLLAAIDRTNGVPEVDASWTHQHVGGFEFIDVREPHELQGPLGAAAGAQAAPRAITPATLRGRNAA